MIGGEPFAGRLAQKVDRSNILKQWHKIREVTEDGLEWRRQFGVNLRGPRMFGQQKKKEKEKKKKKKKKNSLQYNILLLES